MRRKQGVELYQMYTLTCRTHILLRPPRSLRTSNTFMRLHIQAWLKCLTRFISHVCYLFHLAFSLVMIHLSLLFLHGHFETTPDYDLTDSVMHMILPYFPVLQAQEDAQLRTRNAKFGYLAKSDANTGILISSKKRTKATFCSPSAECVIPSSSTHKIGWECVVDSGASMRMVSKRDLDSADLENREDIEESYDGDDGPTARCKPKKKPWKTSIHRHFVSNYFLFERVRCVPRS